MPTIDEINTALVAQLPSVSLTPALFGSGTNVATLLSQYFSGTGGQITIVGVEHANYSFDAGVIQFSGTGQGGRFDGMPIASVSISGSNAAVQLQIEAHPADHWTLDSAFPEMRAPVIADLPFAQVGLYFSSVDTATETLGFYFVGNLDFSKFPLSLLTFLFKNLSGTPQLWGQIQMEGSTSADGTVVQYVPKTVLVFDETADSAPLGPFTLYGPLFKVFCSPDFNTFTKTWVTDVAVRVVTHLRITQQDTSYSFQMTLDVLDFKTDVVFEADIDLPAGAALSEIGKLVGYDLQIPGFQLQDLPTLKAIKVGYNPSAAAIKLIAVEITAATTETWTLWNDVALANIDVVFHMMPKTDGSSGYDLGGEIHGQLVNKGVPWLQIQAAFSAGDYSFSGSLLAPLSISDIYQIFEGTKHEGLPDITVATLDFDLDRPQGGGGVNYSAEIEIDSTWPIPDTPITLDGIRFTITHTASPAETTVVAGGVLTLDDYSVALEADYDSDKGWTFEGQVSATGDAITLGDIVAKIEKTFPIDASKPIDLPPFLAGWFLQSLTAQFTTADKNVDFTATIANADVPGLTIGFGIHLEHGASAYTKTFKADVNVTTSALAIDISAQIQETSAPGPPPSKTLAFTAAYTGTTPPKLSDLLVWIADAANATVNLPAELNLDAEAKAFAIDVEQKDQDPEIVELAGEFGLQVAGSDWDLYFAYTNRASFTADGERALVNGQPVYVFGAAIGGLLDLSKLPLVGRIPGIDKFRIDKLGFFYTNAQFSTATPQLHFDVPAVDSSGSLAPDSTAAVLMQPGFTLMAVFGNDTNASQTGVTPAGTMPLPVATGQPPENQAPGFAQKAAAPADPIHWLDLNKTIGPVSLQKIGIGYEKATDPQSLGTVAFYVDGAFAIAGFAMALDRLGLSVEVPNPSGGVTFNPIDDIAFHLGGLFVSYKSPAFQISGGFITLPGGSVNFIGEFSVIAGEYGLQAYGGFSNQDAHPSLFLFLHIEAPLGGPPFLFVNGLAGGFGVNRSFKLPTFDQLTNYPFLPSSAAIPGPKQLTGDPSAQLATMTQALTSLAQYVPVEDGEYWVAVGLDVSSFEMIDVSAVLSVAFGVNFQVGVVGSATMTLPVNEPEPIAYIQIDFEVVFAPADGLVAAFGKITPASFIYGGMVHLSGGFAFDTWFSGPNTGQYVVTVGGYNLQYQKPQIYPDVPRLQATFGINSLNVTGDAYFALVPHALMAGLDIHATWSLGPLNAWFDAGLDFLLNWKPFHYEADGHIQIGISLVVKILFVKIRITVHAGVTLDVWGPPFGGTATVDLDVVSFTIRFGDQPVTEQVDWAGFRAFLPSVDGDAKTRDARLAAAAPAAQDEGNKPLVNLTAAQGLLKAFKPGESPDGLDWLIDPNGFVLTTQSSAPCTDAAFNAVAHLNAFTTAQYLDPADLTDSVAQALEAKGTEPFFAYAPAGTDPAWNTLSFGITPMGLQNIQSTHTVHLWSLDAEGHISGPENGVIVVLQTQGVSRALWGNEGVTTPSLQGGQELIAGALSGFSLVPMIWFPKRTTFIAYYDLVFDVNDLFIEQDAYPTFNTTPIDYAAATYASMDSGALFASTAGARAGIVSLLQQNGFANLTLANDAALDTAQYLDDPLLVYLSSTNEAEA